MKDYLPDWGRPRVEFVTSDPRAGWVMRPCQLRDQRIQRPPREEGVWRLERECAGGGSYSEGLCVVYTTMGETPPQQRGKQRGVGSHSVPRAALPHTHSPGRGPSRSPVRRFPRCCRGGRRARGRSCNPAWRRRPSGRWAPCSERPAGPLQTRRPGSAPGV